MKRAIGIVAGLAVLAFFSYWPSGLFGQAGAGMTKIASTSAGVTTYTDLTCAVGQTCSYQITGFNANGESNASNTVSVTVTGAPPTTRAIIGWTPGAVDATHAAATGFNIYTG